MCLTNSLGAGSECLLNAAFCCSENPTPKKILAIICGIVFALLTIGLAVAFGLVCANVLQLPDPFLGISMYLITPILLLLSLTSCSLSAGCFKANNRLSTTVA
ncbi:hypothetical protein [Chlamydia sp. 17-3921]|uniref:hypothetical protein n=1 Tax=Chlamydia sp. 17-3921 TaxID=2675798 RepID=UPI00191B7A53|nr:hypothetical protein [Chlamydia sp. 17-3921]